MTVTDIVWLTLGLSVLAFELRGVFRKKKGDTISEYVFAVRDWRPFGLPFGAITVGVFLSWLAYHFLLEGP